MKTNVFLICFNCFVAKYDFLIAPEEKPLMYFDGGEWRTMKPNRNVTSGTRRPNLSGLLDMFLTPSNMSASAYDADLSFTTPQEYNAKIFDDDIQQEIQLKTTENATKEIQYPKVKLNSNDRTDYRTSLSHLINDTQNNLNQGVTNVTSNPEELVKLMLELSKTLKQIADKQNISHIQQLPNPSTTTVISTPIITSTTDDILDITSITNSTSTDITNQTKLNLPANRRMEGIDEIVALLTGGIDIDNGSGSSDELNMDNRKYLRKVLSPKSQVKEINNTADWIRDTDSGDIVSDGVEETRFVLVEDKSDEDVTLRNQ